MRLHSGVRGCEITLGGTRLYSGVRDYTRGCGGAGARDYSGGGGPALRVISSPPELGGEPGRAGWSALGFAACYQRDARTRANETPPSPPVLGREPLRLFRPPLTPPNSGGEIITTVGCPDASHGVRRADAWRVAWRCLACGVAMPGAIKREASARDTEDIPSGLARHFDRIRVVGGRLARHFRSYQSRGWLCLSGIAITRAAAAVMIVISH